VLESEMNILGNRFLITGGAGFIGSHLVDMLLDEGAEKVLVFDNFVRGGIYNLEHALKDERVTLFEVKGDLSRSDEIEKACQGIDGVFHMASICLAYCQEYPRSALDANICGTFNLLEACVKNDVKRVVFASSSSVYGNAVYSPMDENHPFGNRNFYGATKIAGEALHRAFHFKYGLDYLGLRFMNVYGPRQDYLGAYIAVIIKIIDRLQKNLPPIIFGDGSQSFDFVFVKDACRACVLAMRSQLTDEYFNISSGVQVSILELCKTLLRIMEKDVEIEFQRVDDNTLVTDRIGSVEKASSDLGFKVQTSLEDGLQEVVCWKANQCS